MNRRFIQTVWNNWNLQVKMTKNRINRFKFTLMKIIAGWRMIAQETGKRKKAIVMLQRIYRGRLEKRKVDAMREKMLSNKSKARGALIRLKYRGMALAYDGWKAYWRRSKRIKKVSYIRSPLSESGSIPNTVNANSLRSSQLRDGALARGIVYRWDLWKKYVVMTKGLKSACASIINNFARSVLAKTWVARVRRERDAAAYIQRCWRGRAGKQRFAAMKQRAWDNEIRVMTYRARKIRELKREIFYRIIAENKVKKGVLRIQWRLLYMTFKYGLKKYAHFAKLNRDKEYKIMNEMTNKIQSWWRGHLGRQVRKHFLVDQRAVLILAFVVSKSLTPSLLALFFARRCLFSL